MVISCDAPFKTSFSTLCLSLWTNARLRLGFRTAESQGFYDYLVQAQRDESTIQNLLRLISIFEVDGDVPLPSLQITQEMRRSAWELLQERTSVFLFVSSHWRKGGSVEFFLNVAKNLNRHHQAVVLSFGPGDRRRNDSRLLDWIENSNGLGKVLPEVNLPTFAALIACSKLFISNDCGPYHLAVAVGTPTFGIFSNEEARRNFGYHVPHRHLTWCTANSNDLVDEILMASLERISSVAQEPVSSRLNP
jgi:ADP-heptose:LPS heptosyltransferase